MRFLQNLDALCTERDFNGGVFWCYSEKTAFPSPTELPKRDEHFNEGVPTDFENARGRSCLVILEDLLNDVYSNQGSHYRNNSLILIDRTSFTRVVIVESFH